MFALHGAVCRKLDAGASGTGGAAVDPGMGGTLGSGGAMAGIYSAAGPLTI